MANHKKPTKEELEAGIKKAQEEADAIAAKKKDEDPSPSPAPEDPDPSPSKPNDEDPSPSPAPEVNEDPSPSPAPEDPDFKKRYVESTREGQILAAKQREMDKATAEAEGLPMPTDEEMQTEYPDWEDMTATEQKLAKDNLHTKKRFEIMAKAGKEGKDISAWNDKVDAFLVDPKNLTDNPELEGREEEFKIFTTKQSRRGVDFEVLVSAFLYQNRQKKTPDPKKRKMFEDGGTGEEKPKLKDGKISIEESRRLRISNYPKYLEYLRARKIDNSSL